MSKQINHYIEEARELIAAGVTQIEASEKNLMILATALRATDKGDMKSAETFMTLLDR